MNNRILVVDDEEAILFSLRTYFGRLGYEVDCARDSITARKRLLEIEYGLLIADVRLTGAESREGLELVSFAQDLSRVPRIMVLTAYGNAETEQEALSRGADSVLLKPQPLAEVAQLVKLLMASPRSRHSRVFDLDLHRRYAGEAPQQKKVLLVGDGKDALLQRLTLQERTPYQLMIASDVPEAVEKARAGLPDLIVVGAILSRASGVDIYREIRNHAETRNIPIVLVARGDQEHLLRNEPQTGCNSYVMQPDDPEALVKLLQQYLA